MFPEYIKQCFDIRSSFTVLTSLRTLEPNDRASERLDAPVVETWGLLFIQGRCWCVRAPANLPGKRSEIICFRAIAAAKDE